MLNNDNRKPVVVFVCVGNSARSQMAEGLLYYYGREVVDVYSCGTRPSSKVHPHAIDVLKEKGIDIRDYVPSVNSAITAKADYIISLCEADASSCGIVEQRNAVSVNWQLADPVKVEEGLLTEVEQLLVFKETRDNLTERVKQFIGLLCSEGFSDLSVTKRAKSLRKLHDDQLTIEMRKSFEAIFKIDLEKIKVVDILKTLSYPQARKVLVVLFAVISFVAVGSYNAGMKDIFGVFKETPSKQSQSIETEND